MREQEARLMSSSKKSTTSKTIAFYWQHVWRYKKYVLGILIVMPIGILAEQYLSVLVLSGVLNKLSKGEFQPHHLWSNFGTSIVVYAILMLIGTISWRVTDLFNWKLEANVERNIAQQVYDHLLRQSANFHANTFGGSLVSQTTKIMSAYVRVVDTTMYQVIQMVAGIVFTVVILLPRAPLFVVLLLLFSIVYLFSGIFVTRKVRKLTSKQAANESIQTGYLADSVTNIMAIKSFAGGTFERYRFSKVTDTTHDSVLDVMRASQKQMLYFSLMNRIILVLALIMAILGVSIFHANIGTVFLIFSYTGSLVGQFWTFCNNSLRNYNRAFGDAADMVEILQVKPEIVDPVKPETPRIKDGSISFDNVDFTHEGAGEALFHKLNLEVKAGQKIGLVGHSGSGKTTFTRLLLRFSDIDGGEILIDGQNIAHVTQDDLRRHIAYVPQEPIMFHRTLMENIRYGQLDADDAAAIKAAKIAHAHEFIEQLPQGYDTLVGERGVKLSGGQRQRIAIARALLKNAPILLLDEATSALDSESEVLIQDALWKLMKGRTAVVIAHRLSTIQKMDRIIVMEDGKIVEEGSHKKLLKANGTYAKLWAHQSGGFMED
ncbi:MAG TPA: ABC transporter ATP-binding protein [Candidatus Saccharimonadales bacterium]|nr:ABC transporter ATP-binding protein [Candidatus Saccharimonadales bacterium]